MKKLLILSVICVLVLTIALTLTACKPTTPNPDNTPPATDNPTNPPDQSEPITPPTTDKQYVYQFAIGDNEYKVIYTQTENKTNNTLQLYQGAELLTQKTVTVQDSVSQDVVTLTYDFNYMTIRLTDDNKFSVVSIDDSFGLLVGYDYFESNYTANDQLIANGQLKLDDKGKATLKIDSQIVTENVNYYPWGGSGIMLTNIGQYTPNSSLYLTIDKEAKKFKMEGYGIFEGQPQYIFDATSTNITTERKDSITTVYYNDDATKGYLLQRASFGSPVTLKLYVFGTFAKTNQEITIKSFDKEGEEKVYKFVSTDGKVYDWANTVHQLDDNRALTMYEEDYAIYIDDQLRYEGEIVKHLGDGTLTIHSTTNGENLYIVLDGTTYQQKYIINNAGNSRSYRGLLDVTIYKDSEGKYGDILLVNDDNVKIGYFLLDDSFYYVWHDYQTTTDIYGVEKVTVEQGNTYHFILDKQNHTYTFSQA